MGDIAAKASGECGMARAIDIDGDDAARELADGVAALCISQVSYCGISDSFHKINQSVAIRDRK
jgi:hypothetical protein